MGDDTKIEWANATWNPVTGCTHVSRGCDHCYAETFAERWRGIEGHAYEQGFDLTLRPERLDQPARWKRSRMIFVNSMSDLFHRNIPLAFIDRVFDMMEQADWHIYQVLTKRSSLMKAYIHTRYATKGMSAPEHIWLGVSVEDRKAVTRVKHLNETAATTRFLSIEPLLGRIGYIDLSRIHWVIVGGESGPRARPMHKEWATEVRDLCADFDVPFFFKQWGGRTPKAGGRLLDNREHNGFPRMTKRRIARSMGIRRK